MVSSLNNKETLITMPSWHSKAEIAYKGVSGLAKVFRSAINFTKSVVSHMPESVKRCSDMTKVLGIVSFALNAPKGINFAWDAFKTSNSVVRVEKAWQSAVAFGNAVEGLVDTTAFLKTVGVIGSNTLSWASKLSPFTSPLHIVCLLFTTQKYAQAEQFYREMKGHIKPLRGEHKVEDLTKACQTVIANAERFKKICKIGDEAKIADRARAILEQIPEQREDALQKGEEFLKIMSRRVRAMYGFEVSGLVLAISRTVSTIVVVSTPPNPVTLGIVLAINAIALQHFVTSTVMLNSNPFAKPDNVWHQKLMYGVREGIYQTVEKSGELAREGINRLSSRLWSQAAVAA